MCSEFQIIKLTIVKPASKYVHKKLSKCSLMHSCIGHSKFKNLLLITEESHNVQQSLTYCFSQTYTQKLLSFYENMLSAFRLAAKIISPPALTRKYKHKNDRVGDR